MDPSTDTLTSPSSLRASMVRPRPRLPAGPRNRTKQQSQSMQPQLQVQGFDRHQSLPSLSTSPLTASDDPDPMSEAVLAPLSSVASEAVSPSESASNTPRDERPMSLPVLSSLSSTPPVSRPATPATPTMSTIKPVPRAPTLATLPPIAFVPEPLPYKHLTLDAAHWTLSSAELQALVSGAIRESAKEKFIQLLPPTVLEGRMAEDTERVERDADGAAARWRFDVARRNMLIRGLSSAAGQDGEAVHALLGQLVATMGALDGHMQTLLHAAAHRAQLVHARDTHRASALAVALRKLNASYARRTRELERARERIAALEGEVEEAWKVAEDVAGEVDRLKGAVATLQERVAAGARARPPEANGAVVDEGDEVSSEEEEGRDEASMNDMTSISRVEVVGVMGTAKITQARLTMAPAPRSPSTASPVSPPTVFPSMGGPPGNASKRLSTSSQLSRVSAARKRSMRASKASLRIPRARSNSNVHNEIASDKRSVKSKASRRPESEQPPVPVVPADEEVSGSFLEMEGRTTGEEDAGVDADGEEEKGNDGERDVSEDEQGALFVSAYLRI
ncbi:hypothetical protein BV25DRAFT_1357796 [Artomyces pyxidatus]|uniref:Uncharacterized protein n=1 Tax=Artomyces pyxidatus TaxID=48021 RepID=A0ACB8SM17_9AGAM|nr:hypothetical protein BV25DRAFT_1357796 [Artomyces pyxidatus]